MGSTVGEMAAESDGNEQESGMVGFGLVRTALKDFGR
jgi:hypothetical protein